MPVRAATADEFSYLTERSGYLPGSGFRGIVQEVGGRVVGLVGFDGWTPNAVWMHVAVDSAGACRELLRAAFLYAFVETGRGVALGSVRASNARSLRLASRLGFRECARIHGGWARGEDVVLLELRREECRLIGGTHG